jgi:DNA-binding transcriptional ArsR family regulator
MTESIFPTEPSATVPDRSPRFVPLEDAGDIIETVASPTARQIVDAVRDEPKTPSDIADRTETSVQNALYHLERLVDAGLLEVVDTCYSSRGREMDVYAPAPELIVICVGEASVDVDVASAVDSRFRTNGDLADAD